MSKLIDNQMAEYIAKAEAKRQIQCSHQFQTEFKYLLGNVDICTKCHLTKEQFLEIQKTPCLGNYHWYNKKCFTCSLQYFCQAKKELKQ